MKTRVITSIFILAVILPPVLLGGWLLQLLGVFVVCSGCYEWLHAQHGFRKWFLFVLPEMVLWILGLYWMASSPYLFPYIIAAVVYFWSLPVFNRHFSLTNSFSALSLLLIMGLCYICVQKLIPSHQYLWTLCLATYGSDTFAYLSGRWFGKHKMIPRVSPKKTWEGFIGGWIGGFVLSFAVSMLYSSNLNFSVNLAICILAPVFAELGDLCFSSYKRGMGIKDFSNLLPGHGGVLDRIDSLLMNFMLFGVLISLI